MKCPKCGSTHIGGLMQAFWVPLLSDGTMKGQFHEYETETELGPDRLCYDCDHQFSEGDEPEASTRG